jgi:hypothetical protein
MQGKLTDFPISELIEMSCFHQKTGRLEVKYQSTNAILYFNKGNLVHAKVGPLEGVAAFHLALSIPAIDATFNFETGITTNRHTVTASWKDLLSDGLKHLNESSLALNRFQDKQQRLIGNGQQEDTLKDIEQIKEIEEKPISSTPITNITTGYSETSSGVDFNGNNGVNLNSNPSVTKEIEPKQDSLTTNKKSITISLSVILGLLIVVVIVKFSLLLSSNDKPVSELKQINKPVVAKEIVIEKHDFKPVVPVDPGSISQSVEWASNNAAPGEPIANIPDKPVVQRQAPAKPSHPKSSTKTREVAPIPIKPIQIKPTVSRKVMVKIFVSPSGEVTKAEVVSPGGLSSAAKESAIRLALNRRYDQGRSYSTTVPVIVKE